MLGAFPAWGRLAGTWESFTRPLSNWTACIRIIIIFYYSSWSFYISILLIAEPRNTAKTSLNMLLLLIFLIAPTATSGATGAKCRGALSLLFQGSVCFYLRFSYGSYGRVFVGVGSCPCCWSAAPAPSPWVGLQQRGGGGGALALPSCHTFLCLLSACPQARGGLGSSGVLSALPLCAPATRPLGEGGEPVKHPCDGHTSYLCHISSWSTGLPAPARTTASVWWGCWLSPFTCHHGRCCS